MQRAGRRLGKWVLVALKIAKPNLSGNCEPVVIAENASADTGTFDLIKLNRTPLRL